MSDKSIADWVTEVIQIASECRYLTAVGLQLPDVITSGAWTSIWQREIVQARLAEFDGREDELGLSRDQMTDDVNRRRGQ